MESAQATPKKYVESEQRYKETLYRSVYAIRKELEPGLREVVEKSGAPSVSGMVAMLAREPEKCAEALRPIFDELKRTAEAPTRRRLKVTMKSITDELKSGDVSTEELAAMIAALKAKKAGEQQ